jgi:hypothetical protein
LDAKLGLLNLYLIDIDINQVYKSQALNNETFSFKIAIWVGPLFLNQSNNSQQIVSVCAMLLIGILLAMEQCIAKYFHPL